MINSPPNVWELLQQARNALIASESRVADRDVINRIDAALIQRDSWQLAPKEPTHEMADAYWADVEAAPHCQIYGNAERTFQTSVDEYPRRDAEAIAPEFAEAVRECG